MATQNNAPLSGGTTNLSGVGTWFKKHIPGWDTEAYTNYKANLPAGEYAINENDWINQTADKKIAAGHAEHVKQGGTLSLEEFSQGINLNPIISNWNDNDVLDQRTTEAARVAASDKSEAAGGGRINKGDFQKEIDAGRTVVPGYKVDGDTSNFLDVQNNVAATVVPNSPEDTGTGQADKFDPITGEATGGDSKSLTPDDSDKDAAKGIFAKASALFGGSFSEAELKRMTLYTIGGLISGGSAGGSFKWAGMRILEEQQTTAKNAATLGAKQAGLFNKAPKQVRVESGSEPVQAIFMNGQWYDAGTKKVLEGKIVNWDDKYSINGNTKDYNDLITSAMTGIKDEDGKDIKLGATSHTVVNSWMRQVQEWNSKGYGVDINDPDTRGAFTVAVERSLAANKNYEEGRTDMKVPAHFFEATLIQGLAPGGDKNFKDIGGNYLSNEGNKAMVDSIDSIINKGLAEAKKRGKGGTVNLNSVMTAIKGGWGKLTDKEKEQYRVKAGVGRSGFSTFIEEQASSFNK